MKKLKGFTLIELIIVIAVIAVIAAMLVPSMIGYVVRSKLSTANANAKLVYNASDHYCVECMSKGYTVDNSVVAFSMKARQCVRLSAAQDRMQAYSLSR